MNEINILSNMERNEHVIGYYDMLKSKTNFYFVYDFCNGGTLQYILDKDKRLCERRHLKYLNSCWCLLSCCISIV